MTKEQCMDIVKSQQKYVKEALANAIRLPRSVYEYRPHSDADLEQVQGGQTIAEPLLLSGCKSVYYARRTDPGIFYRYLRQALPSSSQWTLIGYYIDPQTCNLILRFYPLADLPLNALEDSDDAAFCANGYAHYPYPFPDLDTDGTDYISEEDWQRYYEPQVCEIIMSGSFKILFDREEEAGDYVCRHVFRDNRDHVQCTMTEIESLRKVTSTIYDTLSKEMTVMTYSD